MIFLILAAICHIGLFGYCFFVSNVSFSKKHALICKRILVGTVIFGIVLCLLSLALLFGAVAGVKDNIAAAKLVRDSVLLFAAVDTGFIAFAVVITFLALLIKSALSPVIPIILPMWAILSLFVSWLCAAWTVFDVLDATPYILMYGIGASFLLSLSPLLQVSRRYKVLSDTNAREELIDSVTKKRAVRQERIDTKKRVSEKKKRLSHPKRK